MHVICTQLRPGHLSVRVGDGSQRSEETVKKSRIAPLKAIITITITNITINTTLILIIRIISIIIIIFVISIITIIIIIIINLNRYSNRNLNEYSN